MRVHIRDLFGKKTTVEVKLSSTVAELKQTLAPNEAIVRVTLVFGKTMLDNASSIGELNLANDSILFLVIKKDSAIAASTTAGSSSSGSNGNSNSNSNNSSSSNNNIGAGDSNAVLYERLVALSRKALDLGDVAGAFRMAEKAKDVQGEDRLAVEAINLMAQAEKKRANYAPALALYSRCLEIVDQSNTKLVAELHLNVVRCVFARHLCSVSVSYVVCYGLCCLSSCWSRFTSVS